MESTSTSLVRKALPFVAMIVVELAMIGSTTLSKAAFTSGLNQYVYIVYYDGLGATILLPWFAYHRLRRCLGQICFYNGLSYTSITVGAAIGNLIPIFTYLLSICFRMERLDLNKSTDQMKALGTLVAVLGALVVTLYKGPSLLPAHHSSDFAREPLSKHSNWPLGGLLFTLGFLLRALWNILQADTAKLYPDEVTLVFFYNLFGTIQTAIASFFLVQVQSAWQLRRKTDIVSVMYAALSITVLSNTVLTWCLRKKGPVFVSMFDPLNVAIAAFMGFVFLADGIYLGSVIGSATIIVGFYAVMWGQAKTTSAMVNKVGELESVSSQVTLLLQAECEKASSVMKSLLPFVAMIAILLVLNGSVTLGKAAMMGGLSPYVYLVYYDALGVVILLPWFVLHCLRGKRLPITFSLLGRFFGLSLIGLSLTSICLYTGLSYTSITVGAAIANLCPVFTYVFAICFRMERLDLRKSTDQIKAFGTFLAVLGAIVVTLYKGPALLEATHGHSNSVDKLLSEQSNWLLGCLFYTIGFLLRSLWSIFQADTAKLYPDEVTIVFFCNLFGTIQSAAVSFFLVKSRSAWKLHHKIEIIAIIYAAILLSVFKNTVTTWCLRKKGPVFVSMFDPLNVAMAVVLGFVFLADGVYLGSVVGSAAIIVGFYAVMWGQAKTTRAITNKIGGSESAYSSQVISPLLLNSHN